jgi:DNA-binding Lrp family transcriptional regulator
MQAANRDLTRALIAEIEQGLPLCERPYAEIGRRIGCSEEEVIAGIRQLQEQGDIKRFGVVVRHRKLGYRANGMVVWNIPDERVAELGRCMGRFPFVTLCYRRPRQLPDWPYNLFTMVHGRDREAVIEKTRLLAESCGLQDIEHEILFSGRCFKQRGARYLSRSVDEPKGDCGHAR